jgi:multidrug efflux pump subunit AcrB
VEADSNRIVAEERQQLQPPDHVAVRGQIQSKNQALEHIGIGLIVAMVAVYLLMAINYQTWGDPFVVLAALPLAFCGIVASLFVTQTSFSIPSLMGAIMSVGVALANSILLVTFAREHREQHGSTAEEAAIASATDWKRRCWYRKCRERCSRPTWPEPRLRCRSHPDRCGSRSMCRILVECRGRGCS